MPDPTGEEAIRRIAEAALDVPGAGEAEVLVLHEWGGLTRFADSAIHQSTAREETGVKVRVIVDGCIGVADTNDLTPEGAAAAAGSALELARVAAPDPEFASLAPPEEVTAPPGYDAATAASTPADRAEAIHALIAACRDGFRAAGAYETSAMEVAVANTEGQFVHALTTRANLTTVISGGYGGAGFAEVTARWREEIDPGAVGARAFAKAHDSQSPTDLDPGDYEVILEPAAVSTLLAFLAYLGFGGRARTEGRSCFSGREGEQLLSERISIWDDGTSPHTLGIPFDFEGTPKRRVDLVRDGVVLGGVHDRRSARSAGTESTGHALPPPNPEGPFPLNLFLGAGDSSLEDMIAGTTRGLLVSRFHYSNIVHPKEAIITGMTRDGTWLVEDGEVRRPVKNLRFTQSIIGALAGVEAVGTETELASEFFFEASRVPALKLSRFRFTGRSDH